MPPDSPTPAEDRATAALAANLLDQGRSIHLLSVALCTGAAVALLLMPGGRTGLAAAAVLLAGLAETWMAVRVGFDASSFRGIARGDDGLSLESFDRTMIRLGVLPPGKAGRPMARRVAGARRLLVVQGVFLLVQAGLLLPVLFIAQRGF